METMAGDEVAEDMTVIFGSGYTVYAFRTSLGSAKQRLAPSEIGEDNVAGLFKNGLAWPIRFSILPIGKPLQRGSVPCVTQGKSLAGLNFQQPSFAKGNSTGGNF